MAEGSTLMAMAALATGSAMGFWFGQAARKNRKVGIRRAKHHPPEHLMHQWIETVAQGWLILTPSNEVAMLNTRAQQLLEVGNRRLDERGVRMISALEPSDELLHLIALARDKQMPQRCNWPLLSATLDVRIMPGTAGWVAIVLQGRNPLESQLEQQEQWVSDVAHELKTPLTALRLVSDSLSMQGDQRQKRLTSKLQKEVMRLQALVSDLLELSRLDNTLPTASNNTPVVQPLEVLQQVWGTLEPIAAQRQIRLEVETAANKNCKARMEPKRLHQALFNLLDNALRYSSDHSAISVTIKARNRWCTISVRDHGPGLSDMDLERMFQRFYRGDPSRARGNREGSGLGLAIVQQIAISQGGMVRAANHPQGGAQLELLMPLAYPRTPEC
jgi:two-component system phosphate regulon sensor histidine kinase PhoR